MEQSLTILKNSKLFEGIAEDVILEKILPYGQLQTYAKGQYLIQPQEILSRFSIILSGKVNILHIFPEGNYSLMAALNPADTFGADLIYTRTQVSPYHAVAVIPTSVMYFPADLPERVGMPWQQVLQRNFLTLLSQENIKKEYRLAILSQKGLRERILTYLTMQAKRRQQTTFSISFSREELAAFLCVNRSALSHELSQMQQDYLAKLIESIREGHV